jgi:hypothetical protein
MSAFQELDNQLPPLCIGSKDLCTRVSGRYGDRYDIQRNIPYRWRAADEWAVHSFVHRERVQQRCVIREHHTAVRIYRHHYDHSIICIRIGIPGAMVPYISANGSLLRVNGPVPPLRCIIGEWRVLSDISMKAALFHLTNVSFMYV